MNRTIPSPQGQSLTDMGMIHNDPVFMAGVQAARDQLADGLTEEQQMEMAFQCMQMMGMGREVNPAELFMMAGQMSAMIPHDVRQHLEQQAMQNVLAEAAEKKKVAEATQKASVEATIAAAEATQKATVHARIAAAEATQKASVEATIAAAEATQKASVEATIAAAETTQKASVEATIAAAEATQKATLEATIAAAEQAKAEESGRHEEVKSTYVEPAVMRPAVVEPAEVKQKDESSWLWRVGTSVVGAGLVGLAGYGLYRYFRS